MKERPILMTPENAQKCHEGTKTQTRRIVKVPNWATDDDILKLACQRPVTGIAYYVDGQPVKRLTCPNGQVGDRLWVRENGWERPARTPKMMRDGADRWEPFYFDALLDLGESDELKGYGFKRRPSIHMPRKYCRTVLDITELRVERLQDISDEDAHAEGVVVRHDAEIAARVAGSPETGARMEYFALWELIHGIGSWYLNPWVWVVSFTKV